MLAKLIARVGIAVLTLVVTLGLVIGAGMPLAWAEEANHPHKAPHGGQMVSAGTYHLEIVIKDHQHLKIYLYDNNLKPLAGLASQATLYLRLPGNKRSTLTLSAKGKGPKSYLAAKHEFGDIHSFDAALRLPLSGKNRNLRFSFHQEDNHKAHKLAD